MFRKLLLTQLALLLASSILLGVALCDDNASIVELGSGSPPVFNIDYRTIGNADIDDLISQAHQKVVGEPDESTTDHSITDGGAASIEDAEVLPEVPVKEDKLDSLENWQEESLKSGICLSIVSDPPGATFYIDGIFAGITPRTIVANPGYHLVDIHLDGYQKWSQVVLVTDGTKTIYGSLTPQAVPSYEANCATDPHNAPEGLTGSDLADEKYKLVLLVFAFLSFILGSGAVSSWAIRHFTTMVAVNFPRDGENRWAGLIEGGSNRVYGTNKNIYVLVRSNDLYLQVISRVVPNREGRWSTKYSPEEGTVYRIYAIVSDVVLRESNYIDDIPAHRAICEVGPITVK